MANLILWRHAEAEVDSVTGKDADRALSKNGHKDAVKMAKWLHQHLPDNTEILCSPARRCLETLAALQQLDEVDTQHKGKKYPVLIVDFLSVDSTAQTILKNVANDNISKTLLLIGHQPNLGRVIAKLLGMNEGACVVKKGALWWLRQRLMVGQSQTYLYAVRNPRD
jgi:phosphohistidine phosphatase